jgi:hypothetical protein
LIKNNFQLQHLLLYLYVFYGPNLSKILFHPHENNYIQKAFTGLLYATEALANTPIVNLDQNQKDNLVLNYGQYLPLQNTSDTKRGLPLLLKML